ncbi:MAG: hypothetical protein CL900_05805 [Dehalococcoidia bacterium]|nr:hypothetical protein [Dehalococcoidia bacterium]
MLLTFLLNSCAPDEWEGFVYPSADDFLSYESIGMFNSLEACRTASVARLTEISAKNQGSYECGKNCHLSARGEECSIKAY